MPRNSLASYALGFFIVVQLAFIVIANVGTIALYMSSSNPAAAALWSVSGPLSEPWAHLTGQEQYWRMFAPAVPPRALFVRMKFRTGRATVDMPSEFEAVPGEPILHLPGSGERMWHVEKTLAAPFAVYDRADVVKNSEEWRAYLKAKFSAERHRYFAYMKWKTHQFMAATRNPGFPEEVELIVAVYQLSRHDRIGEPEFVVLALRWRPGQREDALQMCSETTDGVECESLDP